MNKAKYLAQRRLESVMGGACNSQEEGLGSG